MTALSAQFRRRYLWPTLIFRLSLMGVRDLAYQGKASELSQQIAGDIDTSLI
ncbi:hypothetical protein [Nocardia sp. NPDC049149]|uniref:hypothetical protein n=1 Tax=Nocardia sp. NPDC049149 TaxID=3364315 RepID=UPI0037148004